MGEMDVREGKIRGVFAAASICLGPEILLSAHLCFLPTTKRKLATKKQPQLSIRAKAAASGASRLFPDAALWDDH